MTVQQLIDRLSALPEHMKKAEVRVRVGLDVVRTESADDTWAITTHEAIGGRMFVVITGRNV